MPAVHETLIWRTLWNNVLTYLLHRTESFWEANRFSASQEVPYILWARRLITAFTSARHLFLSWARSVQSMPFEKIHLNIIIPSMGGSSEWSLSLTFVTKILYAHILSHIRATCPTYLILLDLIIQMIFGEEYRSLSSSLCSFLHSPVTSSLTKTSQDSEK